MGIHQRLTAAPSATGSTESKPAAKIASDLLQPCQLSVAALAHQLQIGLYLFPPPHTLTCVICSLGLATNIEQGKVQPPKYSMRRNVRPCAGSQARRSSSPGASGLCFRVPAPSPHTDGCWRLAVAGERKVDGGGGGGGVRGNAIAFASRGPSGSRQASLNQPGSM